MVIILWTVVITSAYAVIMCIVTANSFTIPHEYWTEGVNGSTPFIMVAVLMIFYPLSGFIADVCCGRFKTIILSQTLLTLSFTLLGIVAIMLRNKIDTTHQINILLPSDRLEVTILLLFITASVLFSAGMVGYQANFIQFGLDQLQDDPSQYLALFVHYAVWASNISLLLATVAVYVTFSYSTHVRNIKKLLLLTVPFLLLIGAVVLLLVSCWKHHWFYKEPGQHNPYKSVYKVLHFAWKHKHPLQRSAFTYSDDYIPSRLDFAKERYGGPLTTEEVENVKTLLRILLLLLALGPVYVLQVPASQHMFPLFGYHTGYGSVKKAHWTRAVESGLLIALSSNALFPLYIWYIFSVCRKRIPGMFKRLGFGILLCLLGVISMFITDTVGHSLSTADSANRTRSQCMFQVAKIEYTQEFHPLNMHWSVLVPCSVFLGIGPTIVVTTTLEFISAQSPHSMKGLLVGVFFALQGFFQLIGFLITLPYSINNSWIDKAYPRAISCGFSYLLGMSVIGMIGFTMFIVAAKRYKYRKREDENFNQMIVEEVYMRYINQNTERNSYNSELHE